MPTDTANYMTKLIYELTVDDIGDKFKFSGIIRGLNCNEHNGENRTWTTYTAIIEDEDGGLLPIRGRGSGAYQDGQNVTSIKAASELEKKVTLQGKLEAFPPVYDSDLRVLTLTVEGVVLEGIKQFSAHLVTEN